MNKTNRLGVGLMFILVVSCGAASEEELAEAAAPLIAAQESLEDFQFQIEGGLTYGNVLANWPEVSATVRRSLQDFSDADLSELPEGDHKDLKAFGLAVTGVHDSMAETVEAVRGFIRDDEPESAIGLFYMVATVRMEGLKALRDMALEPGSQLDVEDVSDVEQVFQDLDEQLDDG